MNKERSGSEIISDIDPMIYNVLKCLKEKGSHIINVIENKYYDYSMESFKSAKLALECLPKINSFNRVEYAAAYIAANRMSRSGLFRDFAESNRLRGGQMGDKNAWENYINREIHLTIERLQWVKILNECAFVTIEELSNKSTLFYLDPPYMHETRVTKSAYTHEFSDEDHFRLLKLITRVPGKLFISGYDTELYRLLLKGWTVHSFNRPSDSGQTKVKARRKELVWESPD
jgi:DNA adenine methylase